MYTYIYIRIHICRYVEAVRGAAGWVEGSLAEVGVCIVVDRDLREVLGLRVGNNPLVNNPKDHMCSAQKNCSAEVGTRIVVDGDLREGATISAFRQFQGIPRKFRLRASIGPLPE